MSDPPACPSTWCPKHLFMALVSLLVLGVMDTFTGPHLVFSDFYIVVVALSAWRMGRWPAGTIALTSVVIEGISDELAGKVYPHWGVTAWNLFADLLVFLLIVELIVRLHESLIHEKALARSDPLTGLANRRRFTEAATGEIERLRNYRRPFTLAMMDLDRFKALNDSRGHKAGDRLLKEFAESLRSRVRTTDLAGRLGGDEFAVLFPETDEKGARSVVSEMHEILNRNLSEGKWPVTVSIGAVTFRKSPKTVEEMLSITDKHLYQVKNTKRGGMAFGKH
jgi:diguanylate cyclase (GGDEF)-like protein